MTADEHTTPRTLPTLALLFLLATAASMATLSSLVTVDPTGSVYPMIARNLVSGHGFVIEPGGPPVLWRGPVYPALLAAMWSLSGIDRLAPVVVVHGCLIAMAAWIGYLVARRFAPEAWAVASGVAIAAYPVLGYYAMRYMSEVVYALLLLGITLMLYRAIENDSPRRWALAGAVAGVAALTRPAAMLLPVVVSAWLMARDRDRRSLTRAVLLVAGMSLVVAPWTARNYAVSDRLIPVATGGGYSLWVGNRVVTDGRDDGELETDARLEFESARARIARDDTWLAITPDMDRRFTAAAIAGAVEEPLATAWLVVRKIWRFWFSVYGPELRRLEWALVLVHGSILVAGAVGTARLARGGHVMWPLGIVIGYTMLLHTIVVATARYSVPVVPLVLVLASAAPAGPRDAPQG